MADTAGSDRSQTLQEWAQSLAPRLDIVSASMAEVTLQPGDLVAVFDSVDRCRELVLTWERIDEVDNAVGFVALGTAPERQIEEDRPVGADPEGVSTHTAGRVLRGGIPGALIGGAAVGGTVAAVVGGTGAIIGAVLGGAAFGAVAGGTMSMAKGTGLGDAYQHAFVDPSATAVAVAVFHSTDRGLLESAQQAAREVDGARLARVGDDGRVTASNSSLRPGIAG